MQDSVRTLTAAVSMPNITRRRRAAATICPAPLLPPWAMKRRAPPSTPQRSSSFPRPIRSHAHRCSRLML